MSTRLQELAARRRALVAQSEALRLRLTDSTQGLKRVLGIADLGVAAGRAFMHKPLLLAGIAAALLVLKPRRALRALSLAISAISVFSQLRRVLYARR